MTSIDPSDMFRLEAQELLETLEQTLLDLEHDPADGELIDTAFRALHTIKGSGSMFGFDAVAAFTHHVENAFDLMRKGQVQPNAALIAVALLAKDHMRRLIERPDLAEREAGDAILQALHDALQPGFAAAAPANDRLPAKTWRIRMRLPENAMLMGTNPLLLLDELRDLGAATVTANIEALPELGEFEPGHCYLGWDIVLTTTQPRSAIEDVFIFVIDDMELDISEIESLDESKRIGEILIDRGDVAPVAVAAALAEQKPLGELLIEAGDLSPEKLTAALAEQKHIRTETRAPQADSVRVPATRLDQLMDRVGELVIAQSRLKQVGNASHDLQLKAVAEEIERLVIDLRETTMGIRMLPIGSLFGRFRRLVHDLSRELGKDIELTTFGEETELDKTMIERLNDPLVHMIRNSIDHGIETPEERATAGKPARGRISLTARHAGAEVAITISDDGRGINAEKVRARAEERGLIAPGAALTDNEIYKLIFEPGFSTAAAITSLSGRGVGMDVVKRTIETLRGSIDVASTFGQGSDITMRLPLTLAIIDGLLVRVGNNRYVIPLASVEECVELTAEEDARSLGRSFLNIRGDIVPFLRLRELFKSNTPADPYQKVVIVSTGDTRVGLVVDQVIGDHQTVIKSLSKLHSDINTFSGATILGDGAVALILDIAHMVAFGQSLDTSGLKAAS